MRAGHRKQWLHEAQASLHKSTIPLAHQSAMTNGGLLVQALTFNKMAPMALGRIDIQYRQIGCQVPRMHV